jgi:hypothetical protein
MNNAQKARIIHTLGENGKIFTVTFIKRTTGEARTMNCRMGVTKHLKGGSKPYNDKDHGLITVWDLQAKGYRCIPLESITGINDMNVRVAS